MSVGRFWQRKVPKVGSVLVLAMLKVGRGLVTLCLRSKSEINVFEFFFKRGWSGYSTNGPEKCQVKKKSLAKNVDFSL